MYGQLKKIFVITMLKAKNNVLLTESNYSNIIKFFNIYFILADVE